MTLSADVASLNERPICPLSFNVISLTCSELKGGGLNPISPSVPEVQEGSVCIELRAIYEGVGDDSLMSRHQNALLLLLDFYNYARL